MSIQVTCCLIVTPVAVGSVVPDQDSQPNSSNHRSTRKNFCGLEHCLTSYMVHILAARGQQVRQHSHGPQKVTQILTVVLNTSVQFSRASFLLFHQNLLKGHVF